MKARIFILLLTLGLLSWWVAACRPPVRGNGLNLLLITMETTRADHLGAYGYRRDTSPRLDALAGQGALFERAFSVSPRTNPSLASLMTSLYPHEHGVRSLLLPLEPENHTIAEILRNSGYVTGAVQTHPRLVASSGFDQGFDFYDDDFSDHPLAPQAATAAGDWIRDASGGDRPWFLWLHLMDPHWTYDPPEPWRTRYGPDDPRPALLYQKLARRQITIGPMIFRNQMTRDEVDSFVNFYDAEIRFTDAALGALLDLLEELDLRRKTVVVVTSDHGESLGEHDYFFEHGDFGSDVEIHVPLILAAPDEVPAGIRVPGPVPSLDVAPTLLELLGLPSAPRFRGISLLPLLDGSPGEDRVCFGETGTRFHEENTLREVDGLAGKWRWIRRGSYKLIHIPVSEGPPERRLYDLSTDPGEMVDVKERYPQILDEMGRLLDAWLSEDQGTIEREYHVTPELQEELRSLGYMN